jgi:hypothetical protein
MKKITLTELCAQVGVLIQDSDLNDTNFPSVDQSALNKPLIMRVLMDTDSTKDILKSIRRAKGAVGPADIFDMVSSTEKDERSGKISYVAFGSPHLRDGKEYYPCLRIKDNKAVLTLEHNNHRWRDGWVILAKAKV